MRNRFKSWRGLCECFALFGMGVAGVAGVAGGFGGIVADGGTDGGTSGSGDDRDGESVGLGSDEGNGVLGLRLGKREREEDDGCCSCEVPMVSEVGLVDDGVREGEGLLRLPKEVDRKREGRLEGVGTCRKGGRVGWGKSARSRSDIAQKIKREWGREN